MHPIDSEFVKKVEDLYKKIDYSDYYCILGIEKWATLDKIKKAYYAAAKKFHPDKHLYLPSDTLKNKLNAIFSYLTEGYKILSDSKARMRYDQNLSNKAVKVETNNVELAKIKFREGREAFKTGLYDDAKNLFEQAVYLDKSVAEYFFNLGLTLKQEESWQEAGRILNQAIKLDPLNPIYLAELGHVFLQLGFNLRAKKTFEKVIKIDPLNQLAVKGLQKVRNLV